MSKPYILVIRQLGGVGDVLSMSCVYRGLKEKYPKHKIVNVSSSMYGSGALMDLTRHNPFIDEIIVLEPYEYTTEHTKTTWRTDIPSQVNLIEELPIYKNADKVIDLNTACVEYEHPAMHSKEGVQKPRYQIWCEKAEVVPSTYFPIYEIKKEEQKEADNFLKDSGWDMDKTIGIGIQACDKKRALGIGQLQRVVHLIKEQGFTPVTIDNVTPLEGIECDHIVGKRIQSVIPIIKRFKTIITVDSGIMHMAGAMRVPVIAIFGPTDPKMRMEIYKGSAFNPRKLVSCSPCWYKFPCMSGENRHFSRDHLKCLKLIDARIIVEEAVRWLTRV